MSAPTGPPARTAPVPIAPVAFRTASLTAAGSEARSSTGMRPLSTRTTVTTVGGATCLRANSSPADCASRRPSELSRPKASTTRRAAPSVPTEGAAAPGATPAEGAGGTARNDVSFWGTPPSRTSISPSWRSVTSLPFLSRTTRSRATTSVPALNCGVASCAGERRVAAGRRRTRPPREHLPGPTTTPASSCRLPRVPGDTRALPFFPGPTSKDTAPFPGTAMGRPPHPPPSAPR